MPLDLPFTVTDPIGVPRPVSPQNLFGASRDYFCDNLMPVPAGCLAFFDGEVYAHYQQAILGTIRMSGEAWGAAKSTDEPSRYYFTLAGAPTAIPTYLRESLPEPPRTTLDEVMTYFDLNHRWAPETQLLDLLTIISEDIDPAEFTKLEKEHPWITTFMRG